MIKNRKKIGKERKCATMVEGKLKENIMIVFF